LIPKRESVAGVSCRKKGGSGKGVICCGEEGDGSHPLEERGGGGVKKKILDFLPPAIDKS